MLIAALCCCLAQVPQPPAPAKPLVHEPSAPALAAKAPGAPGYGLQVNTGMGKLMLTNLSFNPVTHKVAARLYRMVGPAGMGPYRLDAELNFHPAQKVASTGGAHPIYYANHFYITKALDGSPAKEASREGRWIIESVDGSNFGWDVHALNAHISNSPVVEMNAAKLPLFGGPTRKTFRITTRRVDTPVDPGDGTLHEVQASGEVLTWLGNGQTWKDLLTLRSRQDRFAPLSIDFAGRKLWVVRAQGDPGREKSSKVSRVLEFWKEDPLMGPFQTGLLDLWPEPEDGLQPGRVVRIESHWYRLQALTQDPANGRLISLEIRPWEADIPALLGGAILSRDLGPLKTPTLRESLEQAANEALLEWKTRTLPGLLTSQDLRPTEDLVIRLEKGLLSLDLEGKTIRNHLDARARAETELKAHAELAAKETAPPLVSNPNKKPKKVKVDPAGKAPTPPPQILPPLSESERLADLVDQRKAILMAILGNAKQALANQRR